MTDATCIEPMKSTTYLVAAWLTRCSTQSFAGAIWRAEMTDLVDEGQSHRVSAYVSARRQAARAAHAARHPQPLAAASRPFVATTRLVWTRSRLRPVSANLFCTSTSRASRICNWQCCTVTPTRWSQGYCRPCAQPMTTISACERPYRRTSTSSTTTTPKVFG